MYEVENKSYVVKNGKDYEKQVKKDFKIFDNEKIKGDWHTEKEYLNYIRRNRVSSKILQEMINHYDESICEIGENDPLLESRFDNVISADGYEYVKEYLRKGTK